MGKMVQGVCECGYESGRLCVGCGFAGPVPHWVPIVCKQCGVLSTMNLYRRQGEAFVERRVGPVCRKCQTRTSLLSDPSLHSTGGGAEPIEKEFPRESDAVALQYEDHFETLYFCPQCREIKMRLLPCGRWD